MTIGALDAQFICVNFGAFWYIFWYPGLVNYVIYTFISSSLRVVTQSLSLQHSLLWPSNQLCPTLVRHQH